MRQTPLQSLEQGHWFKLICGASYQHLPTIRNLALAYTLAGADCLDVAPDPAVIAAAREGIAAANRHSPSPVASGHIPWLMVSLNVGEDPHFRKATLTPDHCPSDCPQPCVTICPAQAIAFPHPLGTAGVQEDRCYGCGRCLPLCPIDQITTQAHPATPQAILPLIRSGQVDAIEIHTQVGQGAAFQDLWHQIAPGIAHLKILAISCPQGEQWLDYLANLYAFMAPLPCPLIWQVDGRPMSGDIGKGTTTATIKLGHQVLQSQIPGFVQLAGGTNGYTVAKLKAMGLLNPAAAEPANHYAPVSSTRYVSGIAYGSYARCLLDPVLMSLETQFAGPTVLENSPDSLEQAVALAHGLVSQLKPLLCDREI